ncbi:Protein CBG27838 [Caenorhabditis briggsae]|uniref:Protein CBG27838 n=1 Tax=Caenorhabditis briggsae TaxID=6238 RepID=B6IKC0_CAEBR|nr:Protein CBG27838 [Caenorhabditis briggsae]CAS00350.1 Protein CBG27838 [Caenorhabditis briggsae]
MNNQESTGAPADGMAFPPFYGQQTPFPYVLVPFPQQYAQYPPCLMYQNENFCGPTQMLPSAGHISQQVFQQPTGQYATGQMPPQAPMQPSSNTGNSQTVNTVLVPGNDGSQQILVDKSELERLREELRDSKIRIAVLESTERFYRANNSKSSSPKTNQVAVSHNVIPQEKITAKETTMETTHQSSSSAENMAESTVVALPLDVFPALEANINSQGSVQKEITHETITATQALILRESMAENLVATPPLVDFPALGILIKSQEPGQKDIKSVESSAPLSYASVAKKCSNAISLPQPLSPKPQHCMTTISIKMDPVPNLPRSPGRKPVFSDKSTSRCTTKSSFEKP